MAIIQTKTRGRRWGSLIHGKYNIQEVLKAVKDPKWQQFRKSLKGTSLVIRHRMLHQYLGNNPTRRKRIQVTNYVYALKRGGMI